MTTALARRQHGRDLVPRYVVALVTGRHPSYIRRIVVPVACDVLTRALLVDLDEVDQLLKSKSTRCRRVA